MKFIARSLLLLVLLATSALGQADLRQVRQARALLGEEVWARVIRVENHTRRGIYPASTHALVFEFNGILWFYTPHDGTQSFSLYQNRLVQDKNDFAPLLREIERGFTSYVELPEEQGERPVPDKVPPLPNACFIESIAALREPRARGEVTRAALLSYYYGANGRHGHTVLTYETREGFFVIDPANATARPRAHDPRLGSDPLQLAAKIHRDARVAQARFLPIDLGPDRVARGAAATVASLNVGGNHAPTGRRAGGRR